MNDEVISIVINLDTRKGFLDAQSEAGIMMKGVKSVDFFTEGIWNKALFFKNFKYEVIVFIDQHEALPFEVKRCLFELVEQLGIIKTLVFSRHREYFNGYHLYPKWNDINFMQALFMARGKYIAHFDADSVIFGEDDSVIKEWINWADSGKYDYVSYPSHWSPKAVDDPSFDYMWASTRFFFCRRDTIQFDETIKCLSDSEYLYNKVGNKERKCPWTEHILGLLSEGNKVYYPKMQMDRYLLFCFNSYKKGTLQHLNSLPYSGVRQWVEEKGGISYPNDVGC